jgi:hypothetical protein
VEAFLPGYEANLTELDEAHLFEYEPCPSGQAYGPFETVDGYILIKFSKYVEAWSTLMRLFVDNDGADELLRVAEPFLNQPQDRVWAIEDGAAFCGSPPPPVPELVDLDSQSNLFEAVKNLAYRRVWGEVCECQNEIGSCQVIPTVTWSVFNPDSNTSTPGEWTPSQVPNQRSGVPGSWYTEVRDGLFGEKALWIFAKCPNGAVSINGGLLLDLTIQNTEARIDDVFLFEAPATPYNEPCRLCPALGPVPNPPRTIPLPESPGNLVFGEPDEMPCIEITVTRGGESEPMVPATFPWLYFDSNGLKRYTEVSTYVPGTPSENSTAFFQKLVEQINGLVETVGNPSRSYPVDGSGFDFFASGGPPTNGFVSIPLLGEPWDFLQLELVGYPTSSSQDVRVFSKPSAPGGISTGIYGWYSVTSAPGAVGERKEIWASNMTIANPGQGIANRLILNLKPGIGYIVYRGRFPAPISESI